MASSPSTHDVAITTEHLGKATDNDVGIGQNMDVQEIANGLIDDNCKIESVCKSTDSA